MNSEALAIFIALLMSSSVNVSTPYTMFSRSVLLKSVGSWLTYPIRLWYHVVSYSLIFMPSTSSSPDLNKDIFSIFLTLKMLKYMIFKNNFKIKNLSLYHPHSFTGCYVVETFKKAYNRWLSRTTCADNRYTLSLPNIEIDTLKHFYIWLCRIMKMNIAKLYLSL